MKIIITGASKGIGRAVADAYAGEGNELWICARNEASVTETAKALKTKYPWVDVRSMAADLSVRADVERFAKWAQDEAGQIDVLVNNAGRFLPGSIAAEPEGTLEELLQTNLYSAYHLTRALLPGMIGAGKGHIFNICSIAALQAYDNGGSYSISKFALLGFSKNLREELKPHNIKVTAVHPGAVYTASWAGSGVDPERIMAADDIARMILAASKLSPRAVVEEIVMRPQLGDL